MSQGGVEVALIEGLPVTCGSCGAPLCLRKQVLNLAVGNTDPLFCLDCLGRELGKSPPEVLSGLTGYVAARECFARDWRRYENRRFCPDPEGCHPAVCFAGDEPAGGKVGDGAET